MSYERVKNLKAWIGHDTGHYHMRYRTFSPGLTQLGYNVTYYHKFNVVPHA